MRLGYLLSYHVDLGIDAWETCLNFLPSEWCHGHAGDSEEMYLDVVYDYGSEHWLLSDAYYSRHGEYAHYGPGPHGYPTAVAYPSHPGAYPRTYVSYHKHANYASQPECDAGQYGFEDCFPQQYSRVVSGASLNLGSRNYQRLNCMPSSDPFYSENGAIECYWTGTTFGGWQTWLPSTSPYSPKLASFGF